MMRYFKTITTKFLLTALLSLAGTVVMAQQAAPAPQPAPANNQLVMLMGFITIVLAFVIWGMGQVLVTMGKQLLDKNKKNSAVMSLFILPGLLLLSPLSQAQEAAVTAVVEPPFNYGMDTTAFWVLAIVILVEMAIIGFMLFSIRRLQAELLPQKEKRRSWLNPSWWKTLDKKIFTRSVPVEREADILLDHDYDGIRELDNSLPPWWKYGFIVTVIVAFVYMLNFHVLGYGKNPEQEYQQEMAEAQEAKALYESKNVGKVDEANLAMPAAAGIAEGKEIFASMCWTCHGKAGEGGAGPNLTDEYWIHKGSLTDIYLSIKNGYPDKGMQSWAKNYSPKQINNLAGYIKSIGGTNPPNARAAQGDLYKEGPATSAVTVTKDSVPAAPTKK